MTKHPVLFATIATLITANGCAIAAMPAHAQSRLPILLSQDVQAPLPPESPSSTVKTPMPSLKFGLQDGTEVKVRFKQTVSSKEAKTNDPVEFEVVEDVKVKGKTVIARGSLARGIVVEARPSGMLGRKGKLDIAIKEVTLTSNERVALRASQKSGGGTAGGIIAIAALINPLALLFKGKNVTYEAGTEVMAYVDGNFELNPVKF